MRVLVADDDELVRDLATLILGGMGLDSVAVEDGHRAILAAQKETFDLALVDMIMPKCDGIETLRGLRQLSPTMRIIAISAGARMIRASEALDWALGLGADATLLKPFTHHDLKVAVQEQLRHHRPPQ